MISKEYETTQFTEAQVDAILKTHGVHSKSL